MGQHRATPVVSLVIFADARRSGQYHQPLAITARTGSIHLHVPPDA
jgi:hypothetical protein